jgi:hypothetical protein
MSSHDRRSSVNKKLLKSIAISRETPDTPEAQALIEELETYLASLYPVEARYGLSVARLLEDQVAFSKRLSLPSSPDELDT